MTRKKSTKEKCNVKEREKKFSLYKMGNNEENLFADGKENSFMQTYYKEQFECGCFLMFLHGKVIFLGIIEMKKLE